MKIIGINGSPRGENSQTKRLIDAVLNGAQETGAEVETINLINYDFKFRNACSICLQQEKCIYPDDFPRVYAKIKEADGIVLGSPVYIDLVTAQMKMLIDRMADGIQCQSLYGKYGCAVATSGDHAEGSVVTYLNHVLQMLGANPVGGVGVALGKDSHTITKAEGEARELGKTLALSIQTQQKDPALEAFHQRYRKKFEDILSGERPEWPLDYDYWVKQAWLW